MVQLVRNSIPTALARDSGTQRARQRAAAACTASCKHPAIHQLMSTRRATAVLCFTGPRVGIGGIYAKEEPPVIHLIAHTAVFLKKTTLDKN